MDLSSVEGMPLDQVPHADYPHEPGRLYECLRCSVECFCTGRAGDTECVFCATLREECLHSWVAGMMVVHPEDLDQVARERARQRGCSPVTCEKCDIEYQVS